MMENIEKIRIYKLMELGFLNLTSKLQSAAIAFKLYKAQSIIRDISERIGKEQVEFIKQSDVHYLIREDGGFDISDATNEEIEKLNELLLQPLLGNISIEIEPMSFEDFHELVKENDLVNEVVILCEGFVWK